MIGSEPDGPADKGTKMNDDMQGGDQLDDTEGHVAAENLADEADEAGGATEGESTAAPGAEDVEAHRIKLIR